MIEVLALILCTVFSLLSLLHFYWLVGGRWGLARAIPTKNEAMTFRPPPVIATLMVALGLLLFGLVYLIKSGHLMLSLPDWLTQYVYWFIPSLFLLRAIGDFNYVGFFKKIKGTTFASTDSKWFSPLCLAIAIVGFTIELISN